MAWETMQDGSIRRRGRGSFDEADLDEDGLTVRLEAGSGYTRVDLDTHIPMSELVGLFERRGYVVTLPSGKEET